MAVIEMKFFSEALSLSTSAHIILPLPRHADTAVKPLPTLLLLHGMGDDDSAWLYKTNIERYACEAGLAVIMPDGELSCYENMAHGPDYRRYILEELPETMRRCFPLSAVRSENYIAGCSMGGFGALKLGRASPEQWSVIGCLSAAHFEYQPPSPRNRHMLELVYGDDLPRIEAQIEDDARSAADKALRIWHACGDRDALKENALRTKAFLEGIPGLNYHFEMLSGAHDWALWDEMLRRFIAALELAPPQQRLM